tara:strand:+ start:1996 stop:2220 length:225 start_codon:yes stop_codon:yes gene_type:complete
MNFEEIMISIEKLYNNWQNDEQFKKCFNNNKTAIDKDFLDCIKHRIKSDLIIISKEELEELNQKYHNSMEGYEY